MSEHDDREGEGEGEGRGGTASGSKIFLSYFPDDVGERGASSVPPDVPWYWCPSIRVIQPDGTPYAGGRLPRDGDSHVQLAIANSGNDAATVSSRLFWCDPTVGFGKGHLRASPELTEPIPTVDVPPGLVVLTDPVPFAPVDTTPDHLCLVAGIAAFGDQPTHPWLPPADCHYGQHNVMVQHVELELVATIPFFLTNPFDEERARLYVTIRPAPREQVDALTAFYPGAEPAGVEDQDLTLILARPPGEPAVELEIDVGADERVPCHALVAPGVVDPGRFAVAVVQMVASSLEREAPARTGELGLVLFPPRRRRG